MTYLYDDNGNVKTDADNKPLRWGLAVLRPPCDHCEKVPASIRSSGVSWQRMQKAAREMTEANEKAFRYYRQCHATGRFDEDDVVKWCAGIIKDVELQHERYQREQAAFPQELFVNLIETLLSLRL